MRFKLAAKLLVIAWTLMKKKVCFDPKCIIGQGNYSDEVNVEVVADLNKPLAIVQGEQDYLLNLSYLKGISIPTLWQGKIQVILDTGHAPHWAQPERFNSLLMKFIKDCS